MKAKVKAIGFRIFRVFMIILLIFKVSNIEASITITRLPLIDHP